MLFHVINISLYKRTDSLNGLIYGFSCVSVMIRSLASEANRHFTLLTVQLDDVISVMLAEHELIDDDALRDVSERHPVVASHQRQLVVERLAAAAEVALTLDAAVRGVSRLALLALLRVTAL